MIIQRICNPLLSRSFFLFGARGTGKTTYIAEQFSKKASVMTIDLLDPDQEEKYSRDPKLLERQVLDVIQDGGWIFIDEVQKIPKLLDVCHRMIVKKRAKFILSGSSARKLKRGGANMLGGRAQICAMHPLTERELGSRFDLETALKWGTLPEVYLCSDDHERRSILKAYTQIYLKEEILVEQLVRNLDPFRLFLEICAQMNTKIINHSQIAREAGVDYKTVQSYFAILEETYLGFYLHSFHESLRKSQLSHAKFYLFDLGVCYALMRNLDRSINPRTTGYGVDFEAFFITECYRLNTYCDKDYRLSYYATKDGVEIDLILSLTTTHYLLEIKSSAVVDPVRVSRFAANVKRLDMSKKKVALWISQDPDSQEIDGVRCLFWQDALKLLF